MANKIQHIENNFDYIIDLQATCKGSGSDKYKWVAGLQEKSKNFLKNMCGKVFVKSNTDYGIKIAGEGDELFKQVVYCRGKYYHRATCK